MRNSYTKHDLTYIHYLLIVSSIKSVKNKRKKEKTFIDLLCKEPSNFLNSIESNLILEEIFVPHFQKIRKIKQYSFINCVSLLFGFLFFWKTSTKVNDNDVIEQNENVIFIVEKS